MASRPPTSAAAARRSPRPASSRGPANPPLLRDDLADSLFLAVYRSFVRVGPEKTSVGDVAAAAGVSRRTIYRYFPSREQLIAAYVRWGVDRFHVLAAARLERLVTFEEQMAELAAMARTPQAAFGETRTMGLSAAMAMFFVGTMHSQPLLRRSIEFLTPYVRAAQARREVRADLDAAQAAEWIARMLYSIAELPSVTFDADDVTAVRGFVRRFLVPGLR